MTLTSPTNSQHCFNLAMVTIQLQPNGLLKNLTKLKKKTKKNSGERLKNLNETVCNCHIYFESADK